MIYVGQAFGDGTRTAAERLRSHSTLQQIHAETASQRPDDEVMLFMFQYEPCRVISHLDGTTKAQISGEEDVRHWVDIVTNPISEKQQIALAEAALIRYFAPHYNEIYKNNFPQEDHRILAECYRLDFTALVVEINTEELGTPLWSPAAAKGLHHIAKFDLHDPTVRQSFFALTEISDRRGLLKSSGPVY